jgi:hypothetical protein
MTGLYGIARVECAGVMTNVTPTGDNRIHSAEDNSKAIADAEELENADLPQDEEDRLDSHS